MLDKFFGLSGDEDFDNLLSFDFLGVDFFDFEFDVVVLFL